ncbi:MAG: hypothetical protein JOZ92_01630 [Candidatus Dormibacteraeota bacterium]|nr:hypothetical protein [Candidatus Dormibacteraeota bacterium]
MSATPPSPPGPPPQPGGAYVPPQASGPIGPPPVGYPTGYPAQPYGYYPATRQPFKRNGFLILAQVLAIIQGVFVMLGGLAFILLPLIFIDRLQQFINDNNLVVNGTVIDAHNAIVPFIVVGAIVAAIGVLITLLAVLAGRPSQVARWILAILEILFLLGSLRTLGNGNATTFTIVAFVIEGLIIIGLIIWPATYAAYARRNLPQRPVTA